MDQTSITLDTVRGKRYAECTLDNFETKTKEQKHSAGMARKYLDDMGKNLAEGRNLILFGPCGTGKDHLMAGLMRNLVDNGMRMQQARAGDDSSRGRLLWSTGPRLWMNFRECVNNPHCSERDFVGLLCRAEVLAISDPILSGHRISEYQATNLYEVVESRGTIGRPTWLTVNANGRDELGEMLSVPIADRLTENAITIWCGGESYRKPAG